MHRVARHTHTLSKAKMSVQQKVPMRVVTTTLTRSKTFKTFNHEVVLRDVHLERLTAAAEEEEVECHHDLTMSTAPTTPVTAATP